MPNKQEIMSRPGLAVQKISDLEERVHYLEDQNLSVRKALETALNQNKYLEDRLEKFGMRLGEIENKAKVGKSFKEEILELLELNQNFEERITVLETKQEENLVDLRSLKEKEDEVARKSQGADLKVSKLLELVKQYDLAREKQASKQNKKIEACEEKMETFLKNNPCKPPSPPSSLDPSTPAFSPAVKTPPNSAVLKGPPLHYTLPTFPIAVHPPTPSNVPSGVLSEQVATIQMSHLNLSQYQAVPVKGYPYTKTMYTPEDSETICIDEAQYSSLVGIGGKKIDSIRDKTQAKITIKEKKDKPPHKYYEVQIEGTCEKVDEAKTMIMNAIYIPLQ